ncbi:MAG: phage major capsid protein [Promicromonosporaceae bacterium]|nr:phage major capsid protein [Promicromonosporaceae bacterium]
MSFTFTRGGRTVNINLTADQIRERIAQIERSKNPSINDRQALEDFEFALSLAGVPDHIPTLDERRARVAELERFERRSNAQNDELAEHRAAVAADDQKRAALLRAAGNLNAQEAAVPETTAPTSSTRNMNPIAASASRSVQLARGTLDTLHRSNHLGSETAERIERMLAGTLDDPTGSDAALWVRTAGSPDYLSAFAKRLRDPVSGHTEFTAAEAEAHRTAQYFGRSALGLSGGASMIPLTLDPTINLTSAGSNGGIRGLARVEQITTNSWNGVTSGGTTAEWKVEHAEASDKTPSVGQKTIPVYTLTCNATVSWELQQDAMNFSTELSRVLFDAAAVSVDAALATGTGSGQPTGIITAATTSPVSTGGAFSSANVVALQNAMPARFSQNASFVAPLPVINAVGSFETANGALRFPEVSDGRLLHRGLTEDSNLSADMTTTGSKFMVYGDFRQYLVATRVGASIVVLPSFGANGRPTADNNFFVALRVGADALIPGAFRVLTKS